MKTEFVIISWMNNLSEAFKKIDTNFEDIRSLLNQHENKVVDMYRELSDSTKEVAIFSIEYQTKPVLFAYENAIKSIDVLIDIVKFITPIMFSVWIASFSINQLSETGDAVQWVLVGLIICMALLLWNRRRITKRHMKRYQIIFDRATESYLEGLEMRHKANKKAVDQLSSVVKQSEKKLAETQNSIHKVKTKL
jgi:uncharacterized coiled-coil protein SlyX